MRGSDLQGWLVQPEDEGKRFKVIADGKVLYEGYDAWKVWEVFWGTGGTAGDVRYLVEDVEMVRIGTPKYRL